MTTKILFQYDSAMRFRSLPPGEKFITGRDDGTKGRLFMKAAVSGDKYYGLDLATGYPYAFDPETTVTIVDVVINVEGPTRRPQSKES